MNNSVSVSARNSDGNLSQVDRRGFTLVELAVAAALLAAVMVTFIPMLVLVGSECRETEKRQAAMNEVDNIMDRLTVEPWGNITNDNFEQVELSGFLQRKLREPVLEIQVESVDDNTKRIQIELTWKSRSGQDHSPVRLTAWAYRSGPN